jgi:hypothetical protein
LVLMASSATMAVNVTLYKKLPYDPTTAFIPLAGRARVPFVLLVNLTLPVYSLLELIAYRNARRPGIARHHQADHATCPPGRVPLRHDRDKSENGRWSIYSGRRNACANAGRRPHN